MSKHRTSVLLITLITIIALGGLVAYYISHKTVSATYAVVSTTFPHCKTDMFDATCSSYIVTAKSDNGYTKVLTVSGFKNNKTDQTNFEAIGTQIGMAAKSHKKVTLTLDGDTITAVTPYP